MMKTWILLQVAALAAVSLAQQDCYRGACYPPTGDLLIGREQQLRATSTCGLTGTEVFCTPYGQWKMKCCPCDSRNPQSRHAHTIQNILSTAGEHRWWMSKKDTGPVSIQFDLPHMFQLDNLVMNFKGPRPDALVIERTTDGGLTWQPARYMATDCRIFPQAIQPRGPRPNPGPALGEASCYTLSPPPANPYVDQKIYFNPLRQYSELNFPDSYKIEAVSGFNGLRINLTQMGQVTQMPGRSLSRYFALRELRVIGTCFCHGHANRCLPITNSNQLAETQINPRCECQHNTVGMNCERCADLFNDLPWRPAEENRPNLCQRCECNNHAQRCRFDPVRYESTNRVSGGVCENCLHHTTGPNCERCAPNYYPNPYSRMDRPDACLRCSCNAAGSESGGQCGGNDGACRCKANVEGPNCDRCKSGYYGLSASNPQGCSRCDCAFAGSRSQSCDQVTGQCPCLPNVQGLNCDRCAVGFWDPNSPSGCQPCDCHPTNAIGDTCDQLTGQCRCRSGYAGRTCSGCPDLHYGDPYTGCRACECDPQGTASCDQRTGACQCRPGVTGVRCDSCSRGRCESFPDCPACPSCFLDMDAQLGNLSLTVKRLSNSIPCRGDCSGPIPGNLGLRFSVLEESLRDIREQLALPTHSADKLDRTLGELSRLRDQLNRLDGDLSGPWRGTNLKPQLDELQRLLDSLSVLHNAKKNALLNSVTENSNGAFDAIKNAYENSNDAVKKADGTGETVKESSDLRQDALDIQNRVQPANTKDLNKLEEQLATKPNLTPTAVQVCGSKRTEPCTPEQCDGELCSPDAARSCLLADECVGALPTAGRAERDTEDVKAKLLELSQNITEANAQMQDTQEKANQVRQTTDDMTNQIKKARDDLENDLQETRNFVRQLKDFLSDPSTDPNRIDEVSNEILNAKLPLSLDALKKKLKELQDLAAGLPDSSKILEESQPQLDQAEKLLEEAQNARDAANGVKDDVAGLLDGLSEVERSLDEMEDKVAQTTTILDGVNPEKVKADLDEADGGLGEVTDTVGTSIPEEMTELKDLVQQNDDLAQKGLDNAQDAEEAAKGITPDLEDLEDKLEELLKAAEAAGDAGEAGETLQKLKEDTKQLLEDTAGIMQTLDEKELSIKQTVEEFNQKSLRLPGLEATVQNLIQEIRREANQHSRCIG
ncbi:laminin subunit beta-3 isoform X2 [Sardina pilchardus]